MTIENLTRLIFDWGCFPIPRIWSKTLTTFHYNMAEALKKPNSMGLIKWPPHLSLANVVDSVLPAGILSNGIYNNTVVG